VYCHENVALVVHDQRALLIQVDAQAPTVSLAEMISRAAGRSDLASAAESLPMLHIFDGVKLLHAHASTLLEQPQEQRARAALAFLSDEKLSAAAFAAYWDEYVDAHKGAPAAAGAGGSGRLDSEGKGSEGSGNGKGSSDAKPKPKLTLASVHTEADARRYAQQARLPQQYAR
jgi:hypothetical protein